MKINMAHGSGGKDSAELMRNIFGKHFANDILDKMEDAAVLDVSGKIACTTDSFVVHPVVFQGGDIGKLAVCGTVNDLLMMGAVPRYLTAGFILEEGLDTELLESIVCSMADTARKAGVQIIAGDTKVVEGRGGLYINTAGIGLIPQERMITAAGCKPGDAVLVSGNLGDHHACILSARMGIENHIQSDCATLNPLVNSLFENKIEVHAMRDVTRGGLGTVLCELAGSSKTGIELHEPAIPVSEETRGFCSILGLDPLYMGNEGKMVAIVAREDEARALAAMKSCPLGCDAAVIGHITEGSGVTMITRLGGKRLVDVLHGEGLPRIC